MLKLGQIIPKVNPIYFDTKIYDVWVDEPHPSQWDPEQLVQLLKGDRKPPDNTALKDIINIAVFPVDTIYLVCEHEQSASQ